jgi:chromosomal replication initiation ATPase DnaA
VRDSALSQDRADGKLRFEKLLHVVAKVHGHGIKDLTASGRHRAWAKPRAQLAYLAREWCSMKAIEIARQLHRDASMVSQLCALSSRSRSQGRKNIAEVIDK